MRGEKSRTRSGSESWQEAGARALYVYHSSQESMGQDEEAYRRTFDSGRRPNSLQSMQRTSAGGRRRVLYKGILSP